MHPELKRACPPAFALPAHNPDHNRIDKALAECFGSAGGLGNRRYYTLS
ncbi:hypothetical protein [Salinimonas sediminis]|nr:hypothetical protein [Salinimonas sediminis]